VSRHPQFVEAFFGAPELLDGLTAVVGGDLDNLTTEERAVLAEIDAVWRCVPGAQGPSSWPAMTFQISRAAVRNPGVAGPGGVYARLSRKEEFGPPSWRRLQPAFPSSAPTAAARRPVEDGTRASGRHHRSRVARTA
jgi:hypothetical protein